MKKLLQSYISFSRTEKSGFIALCTLLLLLIVFKATMHLWIHPEIDAEQEKRLAAEWMKFKQANMMVADTSEDGEEYRKRSDTDDEPLPDKININTADSTTLVRLKGIGPVTAHEILMYRSIHGPFTSIDELLDLASFSDETFAILSRHLVTN
jgi:hypothetical protein